MTDLILASNAVEKINKGGYHAATLLSANEIIAMAALCTLLALKVAELDPIGVAAATVEEQS